MKGKTKDDSDAEIDLEDKFNLMKKEELDSKDIKSSFVKRIDESCVQKPQIKMEQFTKSQSNILKTNSIFRRSEEVQ